VTAEASNPRVTQHGLFLPSFPDVEKLELTLARLASVVGEGNVGSPEVLDTHRPGEFRMEHFLPEREGVADKSRKKHARRSSSVDAATKNSSQTAAMSFRVFRPPLPIHVNAREGRPAEVYLQGRRAEVRQAAGPWRTSGEWWREEQWIEDEWEVYFADQECGRYRIYFDVLRKGWFARGMYD
jgi:protein ImuB